MTPGVYFMKLFSYSTCPFMDKLESSAESNV
jgi:hypothetical protein